MREKAYHFTIRVKKANGSIVTEKHTVSEVDSKIGSAMALGKVVRYYDTLKANKQIKEYRIMV